MSSTRTVPAQVFIDGKWLEPASGQTIQMISPSDSKPISPIARGTKPDIDAAVAAARRALTAHGLA